MFQSFGPSIISTAPGAILAWRCGGGPAGTIAVGDKLFLERHWSLPVPTTPVVDDLQDAGLEPNFRMPRAVEIAAECLLMSSGTSELRLYQAGHATFYQTDAAAFAAAGSTFFGRWEINSPHVQIRGAKIAGGVCTWAMRVAFVFD